ncbi:MAG: hypothetical protein FWE85_06215 [Clostridiales bacterium]|nr:hypothetical protein [Clostridiales bacterium]
MNHNHKRLMGLILLLVMALFMAMNIRAAEAGPPYCDWKQYDARWAGKVLANKSMKEVGCLATSVAMLAVQAGVKSECDFDPGVFVTEMRKAGGFTADNDLVWEKVPQVIPGFAVETPWAELKGTQGEKAARLGAWLDQGFFVAVAVKNGTHWVALRGVFGGAVAMMDPGCTATDLFGKYAASGVTRAALFRAPKKSAPATTQPPAEAPVQEKTGLAGLLGDWKNFELPGLFGDLVRLDLPGLMGDWSNADMAESLLAFVGDMLRLLWQCIRWVLAFAG